MTNNDVNVQARNRVLFNHRISRELLTLSLFLWLCSFDLLGGVPGTAEYETWKL